MVMSHTDTDAPYGSLILNHGSIVSFVTSSGYSHRTRQCIAPDYVRQDHAVGGTRLDISISGEARSAKPASKGIALTNDIFARVR
jgi:glycine cleavage system aminomethyltransferase T